VTAALEFKAVGHDFATPNGTVEVLRAIDLQVAAGEFVCVVGPTGCGKSTLLNLAAGLLAPGAGQVEVDGRPLAGLNRDAGYLFQGDPLLPWRNARDNVALGLELRGTARAEAASRASAWLNRVGLGDAALRYPHQLSGGMKKRVQLAQTLVLEPRLLLMDEPFAALDVQTRALMENELLALWQASAAAVVFVTHDLEEAIALGDRVVVVTAAPGSRVAAEYAIDLARPRDVEEIRLLPRFIELQREIWQALRREVGRGRA